MFKSDTSKGRLQLTGLTLSMLEEAVKASFEARRGKLYNTLRALNAFSVIEIARGGITDDYTDQDVKELVWRALQEQVEKELYDQFRFLYCHRMGLRKFDDPPGVIDRLEVLIPKLDEEFRRRDASRDLARKGGLVRWLLGVQEVGSIEDLLSFANKTLWYAQWAFDDESRYPGLEKRASALHDLLPE